MTTGTYRVEDHFAGKAVTVRDIYNRLLEVAAGFGSYSEDPKKTSIHLNRRSAFAGIATRKDSLILTIKANQDHASPRIHKKEQTSASRWHLEVKLVSPSEIDAELISWLREAYELSA
jgi:hypothetical protein